MTTHDRVGYCDGCHRICKLKTTGKTSFTGKRLAYCDECAGKNSQPPTTKESKCL